MGAGTKTPSQFNMPKAQYREPGGMARDLQARQAGSITRSGTSSSQYEKYAHARTDIRDNIGY